jgi:hypothetical protein
MTARNIPKLGAVRWPAFTSDRASFVADWLGSPAGVSADRVFVEYGHRAPSLWDNYAQWGPAVSSQRVQEIVDSELLAADGALDYFSYNWFPPPSCFTGDPSNKPLQSGIMLPAEAHFASPYKTRVKAMYMVHPAWWSMNTMPVNLPDNFGRAAAYRAHLVAAMQDPAYFRFGGRPVLGVYGYASYPAIQATFQAEIDLLVAALGEPIYILVQDQNQSTVTALASRGARWKVTYGPNPGPALQASNTQYAWENQRSSDVTQWTWVGGGTQYYMSLTPCNDRRPRGPTTWYCDQPTMPEWQLHIAASFNYTQSGYGTANPEIGMIYSWDEIDEGGPGICPTFQERRRYLDALKWARSGVFPASYMYEIDAAQIGSYITKTGSWTKSAQTVGMFNGDEIISGADGDAVDFTHERCRHLGILATKGPDRGIADVYLKEGSGAWVLAGAVDLYSPTVQYQQQVYMSARLSGGTHSISFRDKNAKNGASSSNRVGLDAFRIVYNP